MRRLVLIILLAAAAVACQALKPDPAAVAASRAVFDDLRLGRDFYCSRGKKDKGAVARFAMDAFNVFEPRQLRRIRGQPELTVFRSARLGIARAPAAVHGAVQVLSAF